MEIKANLLNWRDFVEAIAITNTEKDIRPIYYVSQVEAARDGNINKMKQFLEEDFLVNQPINYVEIYRGNAGIQRVRAYKFTVLHVAILFEQIEMVRCLLQSGAKSKGILDMNNGEDRYSCKDIAVQAGNIEIYKMLDEKFQFGFLNEEFRNEVSLRGLFIYFKPEFFDFFIENSNEFDMEKDKTLTKQLFPYCENLLRCAAQYSFDGVKHLVEKYGYDVNFNDNPKCKCIISYILKNNYHEEDLFKTTKFAFEHGLKFYESDLKNYQLKQKHNYTQAKYSKLFTYLEDQTPIPGDRPVDKYSECCLII